MGFDPQPHLMKVRGGQLYLEVKWRLVWLREEHPDASVEVELTHLDLDQKLAVARATITLPNGTRASEIGSETEKDFPAGWVEKAATKAVGRALAALGFGTQFALELDEGDGERPADSPIAAKNGSAGSAPAAIKPAQTPARATAPAARATGATVTASVSQPAAPPPAAAHTPAAAGEEWPRSAADWSRAQLRQRIQEMAGHELKTGKDLLDLARTHGQPQVSSTAEMTQAWLLGLYQAMRAQEYQEMIASVDAGAPDAEERVTRMVAEALSERDRRCIGMAHYDELWAKGEARKAELSAPLLAGTPGRAQVAS